MLVTENGSYRKHIVTVLLQDYFHRGVFKEVIGEKQWSRFESRLEKNVNDVCKLLSTFKIKATFFTLGWIAEKFPEIIKKLVSEGHEIASAGYWARCVRDMTPDQFRDCLRHSKKALEKAGSNKILGYRCAYKTLQDSDLWALEILTEEGYLYDASFRSPLFSIKSQSTRHMAYEYQTTKGKIYEFPASTSPLIGFNIPIAGGNYLRQFPHFLMFSAFKKWCRNTDAPFVLYFHPWEMDSQQPVISAVGGLARIRQYRNLGKMERILPDYFKERQFQSVSQYLDVALEYPNPRLYSSASLANPRPFSGAVRQERKPKFTVIGATVVIPCFNEHSSIPYLSKALDELITESKDRYELLFILVDDGSTDDTYNKLQEVFGRRKNFIILRHDVNRGLTAAIRTGMERADTEIVCSMDADCSYDPLELLKMIPYLEPGVDMITASPYHSNGFVIGVPQWRLLLSKSLSKIYHFILNHKLSSYTSCFRVYRRSAVLDLNNEYSDFRGIVELLAKLDIQGGVIKEYPTTLQCRIFGYSKMKTFKTILGHLKLLLKIIKYRRNSFRNS